MYANLKGKKRDLREKQGMILKANLQVFLWHSGDSSTRNVIPITKEGRIRSGLVFLHLKRIPFFSCRFINVILEMDVSYKTTQSFYFIPLTMTLNWNNYPSKRPWYCADIFELLDHCFLKNFLHNVRCSSFPPFCHCPAILLLPFIFLKSFFTFSCC